MMKPANYAPIYACVYAQLAEIARSHGYAMAAHGSLASDFDLVCIPWVEGASDPQSVIDEITSSFCIEQAGKPEAKEHGRVAYTISFSFGECRLDLSFMPTVKQSAPERVSVPGIEVAARFIEKKAETYAQEYGHDDMGGLSFGQSEHAQVKADYHSGLLELAEELRALLASHGRGEA